MYLNDQILALDADAFERLQQSVRTVAGSITNTRDPIPYQLTPKGWAAAKPSLPAPRRLER